MELTTLELKPYQRVELSTQLAVAMHPVRLHWAVCMVSAMDIPGQQWEIPAARRMAVGDFTLPVMV